jgi:quinoprotein glucose dehydrogenase
MKFRFRFLWAAALAAAACAGYGQQRNGNWPDYLGGADSSHYSPLKQIDRSNVAKLQVAWSYPTSDDVLYALNPIIVDDVAYVMAKNNSIIALDAATGREIWVYQPDVTGRDRHRGMNYWESKDRSERRLLVPFSSMLEAIDARTGKLITSFGNHGKVDLREGLGRDPKTIERIQSGTPGRIFENLLILGSATGEDYLSPPGDIRAYDVRTGKMAWIFHTVPHPGEYGYETWPKDAWKYIGGTNTWGEMTVDEKRGIVYLPIGSPTYDFFGSDRKGDNLFSDCLLALDAGTGKRIWHFQFVHHDLWDYDAVAAPSLLTVKHDGKMVDVVAQVTKQGLVYVFERATGKPVWPIEERPVPKSTMPGEYASPTQPFPTKPPSFARLVFTADDIDPLLLTPEERAAWRDKVQSARNEGLFTPPGKTDTVEMPGNHGGANWGAGATDPADGSLYVVSMDVPAILKLEPQPAARMIPAGTAAQQGLAIYAQNCALCHGARLEGRPPAVPALTGSSKSMDDKSIAEVVRQGVGEMPAFGYFKDAEMKLLTAYLAGRAGGPANAATPMPRPPAPPYPEGVEAPQVRYWTDYGLQAAAIKPPWSTLTRYDLNEGTIKWQVPLGNAPETKVEGTGVLMIRDGAVVTAGGLIFIATKNEGKIRAYDKDNGKVLWEAVLPAGSEGVPAVYEANGKEYLLVCAGANKGPARPNSAGTAFGMSATPGKAYIAYALP